MDCWVFLTDFFHRVLTTDRPANVRVLSGTRFGAYGKYAFVGAAGLAALMALIWTVSWFGNWSLSGRVERAVSAVERSTGALNFANLQALDGLRAELDGLEKDDSLTLHWGLYQGDVLYAIGQKVYFERLRRLSLELVNQTLTGHLLHASSEAQPTGATYDRLKTYHTITVLGCPVDSPTISKVLRATAAEAHPSLGPDEMNLLRTQLDYYVKQLEKTNKPVVRLAESTTAVADARNYLRTAGGLDQQLRSVLEQINRQVKPAAVVEVAPDYRSVLTGNSNT